MILAIAAFLAGGIGAKSLWSAAHVPAPPTAPARDTVEAPEPPADTTPTPSVSPSHHHGSRHRAGRPSHHPKRTTVVGLSAEDTAVRLTNDQREQQDFGSR